MSNSHLQHSHAVDIRSQSPFLLETVTELYFLSLNCFDELTAVQSIHKGLSVGLYTNEVRRGNNFEETFIECVQFTEE